MLVSDFNYDLPDERIAKYPPKERGTTRLLVLDRKTGELQDSYYKNLDDFLKPGDVLILNDTRVMRSRLFCELPDGRKRELVVLEKHGDEPQRVMYRGKLHDGDELVVSNNKIIIEHIIGNGIAEVSSDTSLAELAEKYGAVPLPPYLHRDADENDTKRYQTVWAKHMGSAAAPTASLNMTDDLLKRLQQKGVIIKYLTLHVGLGTFLPIRTDNIEDHKMHSEWFHIPDDTLDAIKNAKRVIALGTTVARTLEYYARTGKTEGEDDIFIYPGFEFQIVDALITNFHAPKSTVLMLASAFAGWDHLKNAYDHAVKEKYNFLSYGDSMFIC
jgi:S-adenosylmethionine:tRNA ribosyltransferase-isomerase